MTEGISEITLGVVAAIDVGDDYSTITEVEPLENEDKVTIEHNKGEVLMIDFWATWCPPCQAPMAHNVDMIEKRGAEWGKDVRIIGLSID